jgi:hypothetical protein
MKNNVPLKSGVYNNTLKNVEVSRATVCENLLRHEWVRMILARTEKSPLFHADRLPADLLAFSLIKGLKHCNAVTCWISGDPKGICGLRLNEHG